MTNNDHISDHDLERFYLGMVTDTTETELLEEHLLICGNCIDRAEQSDDYVDMIRGSLILGGYDLTCLENLIHS